MKPNTKPNLPATDTMTASSRVSRQRPLPGICASLLWLAATSCIADVNAEPVDGHYAPGFVEALGKLESPDPGALPEAKPGIAEVTLSSQRRSDKAAPYRVTFNTSQHELYVTQLLDRDEFRALCDEHKTQEAILAHLK
jgi:hypothetical protein